MIPLPLRSWPHFKAGELACKCCGVHQMAPMFMTRLEQLRAKIGRPLLLSSAYRCPTYNDRVSHSGLTGPHTTGRAVDVRLSGRDALILVWLALELGFSGIGVQQKGAMATRFVHLDDLTGAVGQPRPWLWSY